MFNRSTALLLLAILSLLARGAPPAFAEPIPGGTLEPGQVPKYVTPLVIPPAMPRSAAGATPAADYNIAVREFRQQILPGGIWNTLNGRSDNFGPTRVWGYGRAEDPLPDSSAIAGGGAGVAPALNSTFNYPAFTVENLSGTPTRVRWINQLVADPLACDPASPIGNPACNHLPHLFTVDQSLHWANPPASNCAMGEPNRTDCDTELPEPYLGPVPLVTHVHGAHVTPESDGYPEAWWLPAAGDIPAGYRSTGSSFDQFDRANSLPGSAYYRYGNNQPATTLWYHDHALGMTRLNVYAGPAGFWLIREGDAGETRVDDGTTATVRDGVLPGPAPGLNPDGSVQDVNDLGATSLRRQIREIPVVIQDRSFNYDAQSGATELFYPDSREFFDGFTGPYLGDPQSPSDISGLWNPEVFFNMMVVNGSTWPKLEVAPARYRFRLLNGCNSRTLNLAMFVVGSLGADGIAGTADDVLDTSHELSFYQIGSDQGFLPKVVKVTTGATITFPGNGTVPAPVPGETPEKALLLGPAERADVIVDFTALATGTRVRMINTAPDAPFGGFPDVAADPGSTGQIIDFIVDSGLLVAADAHTTPPQNLVLPAEGALAQETNTRRLTLNEMMSDQVCVSTNPETMAFTTLFSRPAGDPEFMEDCEAAGGEVMGPRQALLGVLSENPASGELESIPLKWGAPITESPRINTTEVWEFYNTTEDAHPIHLHLVRFEVVDRQDLDPETLLPVAGTRVAPQPNESGYKDTVLAYPGQITRLRARFDIAGRYVWHCHIVEHEDNEMMRPFEVLAEDDPPLAPALTLETNGMTATASWLRVDGATGYTLYYAPYPYQGPETIGSVEMESGAELPANARMSATYSLWDGAAYYVGLKSHNANGESDYSNIEWFVIGLEQEHPSH